MMNGYEDTYKARLVECAKKLFDTFRAFANVIREAFSKISEFLQEIKDTQTKIEYARTEKSKWGIPPKIILKSQVINYKPRRLARSNC